MLLFCSRWEALRFQHWGDSQRWPSNLTEALGDPKYAGPSARILLGTGRLPYLDPPRTPEEVLRDGVNEMEAEGDGGGQPGAKTSLSARIFFLKITRPIQAGNGSDFDHL